VHEELEVKCWTKELGVSRDELQKAVEKVANSARRSSQRSGGVTEARGTLAIFGSRPARFFIE
jgi:hypothetical protein